MFCCIVLYLTSVFFLFPHYSARSSSIEHRDLSSGFLRYKLYIQRDHTRSDEICDLVPLALETNNHSQLEIAPRWWKLIIIEAHYSGA